VNNRDVTVSDEVFGRSLQPERFWLRGLAAKPEMEAKHDCGYNGDWYQCIGGFVYGPCEADGCGGVCEITEDCRCLCHEVVAK
jgi:hypothetical protein